LVTGRHSIDSIKEAFAGGFVTFFALRTVNDFSLLHGCLPVPGHFLFDGLPAQGYMRVNQRVYSLPLPFFAIGHVRMVAEWEMKTTAHFTHLASFINRLAARLVDPLLSMVNLPLG
jgi:hypothetical protein